MYSARADIDSIDIEPIPNCMEGTAGEVLLSGVVPTVSKKGNINFSILI